MKYLAAAAAFIATLLLVGGAAIAAVLVFAGPHSDMLPLPLQIVVYVLAWLGVLVVPAMAARAAWRRVSRRAG